MIWPLHNSYLYSPKFLSFLLISTWISIIPESTTNLSCTHPDYDALVELYNQTDGPNWMNNTGWVDGIAGDNCDPCTWFGIDCDANGRVSGIVLTDNGLNGNIPDMDLEFLGVLELGLNQLTGNIPDFSNLPVLEILYCNNNQLTGTIPDFTSLPVLRELILEQNQIEGTIPDFSSLPNLEWVEIGFNQLVGEIPDFTNIPEMYRFRCMNNGLTGNIPDFSNLPVLEILHCANNQLTGTIPDFTSLPVLRELILDQNQIEGTIPNFSGLPNLEWLEVGNNQLVGEIPDFVNSPSMYRFQCMNNDLVGDIPDFTNLPALEIFHCADNLLTGNIPDFSNLPVLRELYVSFNDLTGPIPDLSDITTLDVFYCNSNNLSCFYPDFICDLSVFSSINNSMMPWQGAHANYCVDLSQLGADCEDGNPISENDVIQEDCSCQGVVPCNMSIELAEVDVLCNGDASGEISISIIDGTMPYGIDWNIDIYDGMTTLSSLSANLYTVTVTDDLGCSATVEIEITEPEPLELICLESEAVSTVGGDDGIASITVNGGVEPYHLSYSGPLSGHLDLDAGNQVLENLVAGTYNIEIFDANACSLTCDFEITEPICMMSLSLSANDLSCFDVNDGSILLEIWNGTAPYTINWNVDEFDGQQLLNGLDAGNYQVEVMDAQNCSATAQISLSSVNEISLLVHTIDPLCFGDANGAIIIDTIQGGLPPYEVSFDGVLFEPIADYPYEFSNQSAGNFIIRIQDDNDCIKELEVTIVEPAELLLDLGSDIIIPLGDSVLLQPQLGGMIDSFYWTPTIYIANPQQLSTYVVPRATTTYTLIVFDELGCMNSDEITINVEIPDRNIFIPNVFSPNDDGFNDRFTIYSDGSILEVTDFQVFDRWGNQVFQKKSFLPNGEQNGWDGTIRGEQAPSGVYIYFFEIKGLDGTKQLIKGDILLIQ